METVKKKMLPQKERLLKMLGLCRKAGRIVAGTELACLEMAAKKPPCLAVLASGASHGTQKKIRTKSEYYGISLLVIDCSPEELGQAIGKSAGIAAAVVKDESFAKELVRIESSGKESSLKAEDEI